MKKIFWLRKATTKQYKLLGEDAYIDVEAYEYRWAWTRHLFAFSHLLKRRWYKFIGL